MFPFFFWICMLISQMREVNSVTTSTVPYTFCDTSGMTVRVTLGSGFTNQPYVRGYRSDANCAFTMLNSTDYTVTFASLTACDLGGTGNLHTTRIVVPTRSDGIELHTDEQLAVICETVGDKTITKSVVSINANNWNRNPSDTSNRTIGEPTLTFELLLENGSPIVGTLELGTRVKLQIKMTDNEDDAFVAIKAFNLFASTLASTTDNSTILQLIETDGCASNIAIFPQLTRITGLAVEEHGAEGIFDMFKFASSDVVFFHVSIIVCPSGATASCDSSTCGGAPLVGLGRKKRSIRDVSKWIVNGNKTLHFTHTVGVRVRDPAAKTPGERPIAPTVVPSRDSFLVCLTSGQLAVTAVVAVGLLLAAFMIAVFFCIKIRNRPDRMGSSPMITIPRPILRYSPIKDRDDTSLVVDTSTNKYFPDRPRLSSSLTQYDAQN